MHVCLFALRPCYASCQGGERIGPEQQAAGHGAMSRGRWDKHHVCYSRSSPRSLLCTELCFVRWTRRRRRCMRRRGSG